MDLPRLNPTKWIPSDGGGVRTCAITPDGRWVAASCFDHVVRVWDARKGACVRELQGIRSATFGCAISNDGERVATACMGGNVRLWSVSTGEVEWEMPRSARMRSAFDCALSGNAATLVATLQGRGASASRVGEVVVADLSTRALADGPAIDASLDVVPVDDGAPFDCVLSHDASVIAFAVWNVSDRTEHDVCYAAVFRKGRAQDMRKWKCEHRTIKPALSLDVDGEWLCISDATGVRLCSTTAAVPDRRIDVRPPVGSGYQLYCSGADDFSRLVVSTSEDQFLMITIDDNGKGKAREVARLPLTEFVTGCQITPDGRHLITSSRDPVIQAFELTDEAFRQLDEAGREPSADGAGTG